MPDLSAPILLVDDLPANLVALDAVLRNLGEPIVQAGSGQEALSRLLKEDFAVILLDVRMPGMDGLETARYIRMASRTKSTPIIFVTAGDGDLEDALAGYSAGAVDYIKKPIQTDILRSKVRVFIDLYRKEKELAWRAEELARTNEELRTACRDLEVFTYAVAHEFRAPLRAMTGFCQILQDQYRDKPFDQEGQECARRIEGGARRMDALIRDLLSYCNVARTRVDTGPVDPTQMIREALRNLALEIESSGAGVTVDDDFPTVVANPSLLSLALTTLLSNALKFVSEEVRPKVRIGHDVQDGRIRIWVQDNGTGIPPQYQERIFGIFERLQNSPEIPGTGIGLAIAKVAAERISARVGVESQPGHGSKFWIEFLAATTPVKPALIPPDFVREASL